jgi:hypothetical protein
MGYTKIIGISIICLSSLLMLICLMKTNSNFFNLKSVISLHLKLFDSSKNQYFIFYVLPLLFSIGLTLLYTAGETFYTNLSIIISILLSMLLAILSILTEKEYNSINDVKQKAKLHQVVKETINAIIFDALLCVFLLLYGLVMVVIDDVSINIGIVKSIFAGVSYYFFTVILLNLLLIIKRMSKIIEFTLNRNV